MSEGVPNPFEGGDLKGPEFRAKFKLEGDGDNEMFSMAAPGFPPWVFIVFDGPKNAHFKMLKSTDPETVVGPYMMHSIVFHLDVISRFQALQNLVAVGVQKSKGGVWTPGMQVPPDFDPKSM